MNILTKAILIVVLGLLTMTGFGQTKISGTVVDEVDKTKLTNATVMLLQAKDSILIDFTRADQEGRFQLENPDTADYLLIVSYPKFGDYFQKITQGSGDQSLGQLQMQSAANLIEEVLVTGKIPVVVKGDTIEYDAGSFVTEKNAKVEDLLKVLPGISVDANGQITAQGKTVEKVLVDGEEFFGDDPTLVTRNIRSDMVDKVQVYEKKSEESERTGVDDGERIQTINVQLKEDAKKGVFGKIEGAGGVDDDSGYYLGKLAVNKFNGSQKIGAYLLSSNDGTVSLNWEEEEKFNLSDGQMEVTESGGMNFTYTGDEFSYWNGKGQPVAISTGISFIDAWKDKKHKLNLSYKYANIKNDILENNINQTPSDNGPLISDVNSENSSDAFRHRFNSKYDWDLDSLTTMTLKLSGSRSQVERNSHMDGNTFQGEDMVSENFSNQSTKTINNNLTYDGYLTRRFKKEGRSISLRVAGNNSTNEGDMQLNSEANYLSLGRVDTIDQMKAISSSSNNLRTSLTYTEPLGKKFRTSVGYEYNLSQSHSVNNSFNKDQGGGYTELDELYSNDFNFNTIRNAANVTLGYKTDKIDFNFTNNFRVDNMEQINNYEATDLKRDYFTYNPSAWLRYKFSKSSTLGLNYNRNTQLPSLFQIQPLRQNTDQLNQIIGNENLKPANQNRFSISYNSYEMLKGKYIYGNASFTQHNDAIRQNVTIFSGGRREMYYTNVDQPAYNANLWLGGGFNLIRKHQIKADLGLTANLDAYSNFIKDLSDGSEDADFQANDNTSYSYSARIGAYKNTTKNIDFHVNFQPGWSVMNTTLNPDLNSDGFVFNSSLWFKYHLPAKFSLYGDMRYEYQAPTSAFPDKFERVLFKPGISRKFLKGENLVVDFYINDAFNQNTGFRRFQSGNAISQNSYNTISRYYMLKVSWDFTSMSKGD